jgi:hypothetical protein
MIERLLFNAEVVVVMPFVQCLLRAFKPAVVLDDGVRKEKAREDEKRKTAADTFLIRMRMETECNPFGENAVRSSNRAARKSNLFFYATLHAKGILETVDLLTGVTLPQTIMKVDRRQKSLFNPTT